MDSKPPRAQSFRIERLANHLGISRELLPLVASVLGNDFVSDDVRQILYKDLEIDRPFYAEKILSKIISLLKTNSKLEDALRIVLGRVSDQDRRKRVQKALKRSIESYKDCGTVLATYFETGEVTSKHESHATRETWVLEKIRQGLFPLICMEVLAVGRRFLKPQVEDFDAPAADQCSLELRRFLYGFLGNREDGKTDVEEYYRVRVDLTQRTVRPCRDLGGYGQLPSNLRAVLDLDIDDRRTLCLLLLESNVDRVLRLPEELQIFAASLRYWYTHADPPPKASHLRALIMCHVVLKGERGLQGSLASTSFDLAAQHSFAQWQCVMREVVNLNLVLQEPLPTPCVRHLYDGRLLQYLVLDIESGRFVIVLLSAQ